MKQTAALLIIDDDSSARATLEAMLLPDGYDLRFAANGEQALSDMVTHPPDLVLLDVMMPGMDGFEVCRRIKAEGRWRMVPVIIITSLDSQGHLQEGLAAGADDFLSKPASMTEVRVRVKSLLRIKQQYDALAALLQQRETLVNMLVHDLRQPLTLIMTVNAILVKRLTDASALEYIEEAQFEARRLNGMMDQMLVVARTQTHQLVLARVPVDVSHLVQEACAAHVLLAEAREIQLRVDLPHVAPWVSLDRSMMRRLLDNLISNALKFSPRASAVTIQVENGTGNGTGDGGVHIRVIDEGPGIPPEHVEHIFNLYDIVDLGMEGVPQIGIGLSFCKIVSEAHGGKISVVPNKPHGSVFVVEIEGQKSASPPAVSPVLTKE